MMNRQPAQKFMFQVLWLCFATLAPVSVSFWFHYHHMPYWSTFLFVPIMAIPTVAAMNYLQARKR